MISPEVAHYIEYGVELGLLAMAFSKSLRKEVYNRQHGNCAICGKHLPRFETHHIVPHCMSHDDSEENAVGLCHECHSYADNMALHHHLFYPDIKELWEQQEHE